MRLSITGLELADCNYESRIVMDDNGFGILKKCCDAKHAAQNILKITPTTIHWLSFQFVVKRI